MNSLPGRAFPSAIMRARAFVEVYYRFTVLLDRQTPLQLARIPLLQLFQARSEMFDRKPVIHALLLYSRGCVLNCRKRPLKRRAGRYLLPFFDRRHAFIKTARGKRPHELIDHLAQLGRLGGRKQSIPHPS